MICSTTSSSSIDSNLGARPAILNASPAWPGSVRSRSLAAGLVSCRQTENHTPPPTAVFQEIERLGDNVHLESDERAAIANSRLRLEFDRSTGDWVSRTVDGLAESLVALNEPGSALDFRVDQEWMCEEYGTKLRETSTRSDETDVRERQGDPQLEVRMTREALFESLAAQTRDMVEAARNSLDTRGFGLASVRFICGTHEHHGVMDRIDILTGTLGKALGGANGGLSVGAHNRPVIGA